MMKLTPDRLLPGTTAQRDALCLPAQGGGFLVNEIAQTQDRYLNLTLTVQEEHSMTFELRV